MGTFFLAQRVCSYRIILLLFRAIIPDASQLALENLALRQRLTVRRRNAPRPLPAASRRPTGRRIRHLEEASFTSPAADEVFGRDNPGPHMRCPTRRRAAERLVARPSPPRLKLLPDLAGDGGIAIDVPLNSLKCIQLGHLHDTLNRRVAAPLTVIRMVFPTRAAVAALRGTPWLEPTRAVRVDYRHIPFKAHWNASLDACPSENSVLPFPTWLYGPSPAYSAPHLDLSASLPIPATRTQTLSWSNPMSSKGPSNARLL